MGHLHENGHGIGPDALVEQAAALEPARNSKRLTHAELISITELAIGAHSSVHSDAQPRWSSHGWTGRRRRFITLGTVLTCVVVGAGIIALEFAGPNAPSLGSPVLKFDRSGVPGFVNNSPEIDYEFLADPSLPTANGTSTAYELVSPTDVATVTGTIATAFGLSGAVTSSGPDSYHVGPNNGPFVGVATSSGILHWMYNSALSDPVSSWPGSLPSDSQATASAEQLLQSIGAGAQLGAAVEYRHSFTVDVEVPMVANGMQTDQIEQVVYGPGSRPYIAMGIIATAMPSASYPTISANEAVSLLSGYWGWTKSGGTPNVSATNTGQPIESVDINQASMDLATYTLSDGTSWMLPTWALSGPASGSAVTSGSTYSGSALAVSSKFVQLQPGPN